MEDLDRRSLDSIKYALQPDIIVLENGNATQLPAGWDGLLLLAAEQIIVNTGVQGVTFSNRNIIIPSGYDYIECSAGFYGVGGTTSAPTTFGYWVLTPVVNGTNIGRFGDTVFGMEANSAGTSRFIRTSPYFFATRPGDYTTKIGFRVQVSSENSQLQGSWAMFKCYHI